MTLRGERNLELTGPGVAQPIQSQSQRSFQVTVSNDPNDTTRDVSDRSRQSSSGTTVRIIDGTLDGLSFDRVTDVMAVRCPAVTIACRTCHIKVWMIAILHANVLYEV